MLTKGAPQRLTGNSGTAAKLILVVDDHAVVREPIAAYLRMTGYRTVCASDGEEALTAARRARPDLVLLDLAMPGLDGLGFLRLLRAEPNLADVPVIMLTASANREPVMEAAGLGIKGYILKSQFSLGHLVSRIREILPESGSTAAPPVSDSSRMIREAISSHPQTPSMVIEPAAPPAAARPADARRADTPAPAPSAADAQHPQEVVSPAADAAADAASAEPSGDSLKSLKPLITRSEITDLIDNSGELKALSPTVMQIVKLTASSNCSIDQVVSTVKQDQAIALKILKLANSAVYTRGEPVENVQKAVMRIGLAEIRQVVLNIAVVDQFSSTQLDGLDTLQFWEHSIACGLICSELARATGASEADIDAYFTMGLLHDVGRLVYAEKLGDTYAKVIQTASELRLPLEAVERRLLLVDHATAMDRILHGWHFPKNLINPIAFHHLSMSNIRHMARQSVSQVAILALADRLAHALLLGDSGNPTIYPIEEYCQALRLPADALHAIEQTVPDETDEMKFTMVSRGTPGNWPQSRQIIQQRFKHRFHPIFISGGPELDAYRILTDRLRSAPSEDQPPNIAVVHFAEARGRSAITAALQAAEQQAGVANLPVVMISPGGKFQLEDQCKAGRACISLASPVHLHDFVESVNQLLDRAAATG